MLQQRKKDYLQRLIEEFFKKLQVFVNSNNDDTLSASENKSVLDECFDFFTHHFETAKEDTTSQLIQKIEDSDLLEHYAKILVTEYDLDRQSGKEGLEKALSLIEFLQDTDTTYSWDRVVLREDILRRLDESI